MAFTSFSSRASCRLVMVIARRDARRFMRENYGHLDGDRLLTATVQENVLVQLESLQTLPAVDSRLVRGDLHLHGWVYKIETGAIFAYDLTSGQFAPLAELRYLHGATAARKVTSANI